MHAEQEQKATRALVLENERKWKSTNEKKKNKNNNTGTQKELDGQNQCSHVFLINLFRGKHNHITFGHSYTHTRTK